MIKKVVKAIILGAPGSGKGTISERILKDFSMKHLASGDLLRSQILKGTDIGVSAKKYIDKGQLVPDNLVLQLILETIQAHKDDTWLLDGFPRTLNQAITLNKIQPINFVINLNVPFDIIIERIKGRWIHMPSGRVYHTEFNPPKVQGIDDVTQEPLVQREDDKPETVRHRLNVYKELTQPVLDFYRKNQLLEEFTGNSTPEIWPKVRQFISTKLEPVQKTEYK
ncbi:AMP phosphotransferase AK3, mitochondrial-like [Octopus vulgaris]|nr:AMP phosphotransferase AK3, mitochondrial-like [Octopus vulgaris]